MQEKKHFQILVDCAGKFLYIIYVKKWYATDDEKN